MNIDYHSKPINFHLLEEYLWSLSDPTLQLRPEATVSEGVSKVSALVELPF